jgi:hypothetical protein
MKKIIFLADMFASDHTGGAELHDDVVISHFKDKGILCDVVKCLSLKEKYINNNRDKVWFISNFTSLKNQHKAMLAKNCSYIIYEHDYKFIKVRNPISFSEFIIPQNQFTNVNFYRNAKKIICLSKMHKEIFDKNLNLNNIVNINCSMWHDSDLKIFEELQSIKKKSKFAVIESTNPIKKTKQSVEFCIKNDIPFDLVSSRDYMTFIKKLSEYKGLIFMTGHPEPTPRVAIEAKMLNMKFISQKNLIGVAHEDYFHLTGKDMIDEVKKMRNEALLKIEDWINEV